MLLQLNAVEATHASSDDVYDDVYDIVTDVAAGHHPVTEIAEGLRRIVEYVQGPRYPGAKTDSRAVSARQVQFSSEDDLPCRVRSGPPRSSSRVVGAPALSFPGRRRVQAVGRWALKGRRVMALQS